MRLLGGSLWNFQIVLQNQQQHIICLVVVCGLVAHLLNIWSLPSQADTVTILVLVSFFHTWLKDLNDLQLLIQVPNQLAAAC